MSIINYTQEMIDLGAHGSHNLVKAQGENKNVLILRKLDERIKRADGKMAGYELEYRWLSQECEKADDEAYVCVQGSEVSYWQRKEIKEALQVNSNMFEHFNLF